MSEKRIKEYYLKFVVLFIISESVSITTNEIIKISTDLFIPTGTDSLIAKNRNDTYFSQKVRNVKSHNSLINYTNYDETSGLWTINDKGILFVNRHSDVFSSILTVLQDTTFSYENKLDFIEKKIANIFGKKTQKTDVDPISTKKVIEDYLFIDENEMISEGRNVVRNVKTKERSKALRTAALKFYSNNGSIKCSICGFDFGITYDGLGTGYIEMHHIIPIATMENEPEEKFLKDAIQNIIPVCANCHRMLHRKKDVSISSLKEIYVNEMKKNYKNKFE